MLYPIARGFFRIIFRVLWRWKIEGLENLPLNKPVVVVSNHVSVWDPIVIGTALPRPVNFMAKEELFQYPLFRSILSKLHAFPVKRGQPDRAAIRRSLEILHSGGILGIFPEGSRSKTGELLKPHSGVAMIALKAQAAVVPIACIGTEKIGKKGSYFKPFMLRIGKPLELTEYYNQKLNAKNLELVSQQIIDQISLLLKTE